MYNISAPISDRILNSNKPHYFSFYYNILSTIHDDAKYDSYYIVSPSDFFHKADHLKSMADIDNYIPEDILEKLKSNQCLLIIDLSYEANGLYTDEVKDREWPLSNSHSVDIYSSVQKYADTNGIINNVKFISMMHNAADYVIRNYYNGDPLQYNLGVQVYSCPSIPTRYKKFNYDDYAHLLTVNGLEKNGLWLNRRIRNHRVGLIAACVDKHIDFNKFDFSFIGSKFEIYDTSDYEDDKHAILINRYVNDTIIFKKILKLFGKIVGLDNSKSPQEMNEWLATSDIGRVVEMHKIRSNAAYEIVSEFTFNDIGVHMSEKISLPILGKKPFVVSGDKGFLKELRRLGFKTFHDFWPEDYDDINEHDDSVPSRTEKLADTIGYIEENFHTNNYYTRDTFGNVIYCDKMKEIVEYNYNHFHTVFYDTLVQNWQNVFSNDNNIPVLKGMHPLEAEQLVIENETWEDTVWYHTDTNHIFIPIWRNGNTFFHKVCAEKFGYRLVKKYDLKNYRDIPAYAFLRSPEKRITGQLWRAFKNSNITIFDLKNTEDWSVLDMHLIRQTDFIEDFNLEYAIDLDNPNRIENEQSDIISVINDVCDIITEVKREFNNSSQDTEFVEFANVITSEEWFVRKSKEYYRCDYKLFKDNTRQC